MYSKAVGENLPLWAPEEAEVRIAFERVVREALEGLGYRRVYTPHILQTLDDGPCALGPSLPPMREDIDEEAMSLTNLDRELFYLRTSTCFLHSKVFEAEPHSYRELPIRYYEIGECYYKDEQGKVACWVGVFLHAFLLEEQWEAEKEALMSLQKVHIPVSFKITDGGGLLVGGPDNTKVPVFAVHGDCPLPRP